jgi:hypothetical protein
MGFQSTGMCGSSDQLPCPLGPRYQVVWPFTGGDGGSLSSGHKEDAVVSEDGFAGRLAGLDVLAGHQGQQRHRPLLVFGQAVDRQAVDDVQVKASSTSADTSATAIYTRIPPARVAEAVGRLDFRAR